MIIVCVTAACSTQVLRGRCAEAALCQGSLPTHSPFFLRSRYYFRSESDSNWSTHLFYQIYLSVYPSTLNPPAALAAPPAHTSRPFAALIERKVQQHHSGCLDWSRFRLELPCRRWWVAASTTYLRRRIDLSSSSSHSRFVDARTSQSCQVTARII